MEKYVTARLATHANIMRRITDAIFMLDNKGNNTDTHSKYLIIILFPMQRWLSERASILLYTNIACVVCF
jgi:hypothetical protein